MEPSPTSHVDFRYGTSTVVGQDQYNYVFQEAKTTAEILQNLQPVRMDASGRTECLEGTREETIQFIIDWATDPPIRTENVLWVHGLAGTGKSTLATTMANHFRRKRRLGAFLFFDRAVAERSDPLTVIRTLAHQIGSFHPCAGQAIADAIDESPDICLSPLRDQFQELLIGPLSSKRVVDANISIVLVLDALDECGSGKEREILLEVLVEQSVKLPPAIRILITSRSDTNIYDAIQSQHITSYELRTTSEVNEEDISSYLRHRIGLIQRKRGRLKLASDWPGEDNIRKLIKRASGLFVWASTAMEFIDRYDPRVRLDMILNEEAVSEAQSTLDTLYMTALDSLGHSGIWDDKDFIADFTAIIGLVLVARHPLSTTAIDALLGLSGGRPCDYTISHLGCVLQQPIVRVLHPSFADFLLDRSRCGREVWFFDSSVHHRRLATHCLDHLDNVLRENICNLMISEDIWNETLPDHVSYACNFWIDHICTIEEDTDSITEYLDTFISRHLLHWFEAMSILRRSRDTIGKLDRLLDWMQIHFSSQDSLSGPKLIRDACHFARIFYDSIEEHPLLVYMAALPFTPTDTTLYRTFHDVHSHPSMPQSFGPAWSTLVRVLVRHGWSDSRILSVAFSADGTRVVSGSYDKMIRVMDATSGTEVIPTLSGHDGWVHSVDISSDGTRIVSGSQDKTIRIWDIASGAEAVPTLRGHEGAVLSVAFSVDGNRTVSGSRDKTVRVWDTNTGVEFIPALRGHDGGVESVAFFPDGLRIVSGSVDKTVRVWDTILGTEVLALLHGQPVMSVTTDGTHIISGSYKNKRVWEAESGRQRSSDDEPTAWFSSEIDDGWIIDINSRERVSKIPSIVKTRSWLLEQLTVKYGFCRFRPLFSRTLASKE